MIQTKSSYWLNNFKQDFKSIIEEVKPKLIVEFGIGNGYSMEAFIDFASEDCNIHVYDLFEEFQYNHADYKEIKNRFCERKNVDIQKLDFYKGVERYKDDTIDLLHIDIANDGDVYEFAVNNWFSKVSENGVMVLEGGSHQRDNVYWMIQFKKRKINPYLLKIYNDYDINIIEKYPSMTIIKRKK